jgi:hypothetical protein
MLVYASSEKRVSAGFSAEDKPSGNIETGSSGMASGSTNGGAASTNTTERIEIREGDWKAYLYFSKKRHDPDVLLAAYGTLTTYKRACAMAYLGRRAQVNGGVCSTSHAHILTPQFVAGLEANNKSQRFARYPWLESLLNVLVEIERLQDEISGGSNVISMVGVTRT